MARIRSIKPEFWKSEAIAVHTFRARLTFIGLWTYVDDNGVGIDNPKLVAAELFALEDDPREALANVREDLARLHEAGRIRRYTVDGKAYLAIVNWREHQKIDKPGKPRYPEPDDPRAVHVEATTSANPPAPEPLAEASRESRETVAESPCLDQGSGIREQGAEDPPPLASLDGGAGEPDDVIDAEIVNDFARLAAVPNLPATLGPENAGQITGQWIDHCKAHGVQLTNTHIKRYGAGIKAALDQKFEPQLIKDALAQMLADRVASRPALLDNYLVRAQQGPELPPRRMSRAEESAARLTPDGTAPGQHLYDILTRPA
ncbi:hypothetical protein [Micromonospora sp. NBRC 101691]|uniref:hypothetical protein n=1 Tax=Micromonospora sp. NBRC 101691 TaxID=3032198 RepID=UPI0024A0D50B|nr:hypothetical protein [Micromonospora sp. NBRC 101691]GLY21671.1 hypothetical protein Misp04_14030 [Micromonospora sp. NBRC 101691]